MSLGDALLPVASLGASLLLSPPPYCRQYDIIVVGPTTADTPNEEMRLQLANTAIAGGDPEMRSVQRYNSLTEVMAARSPYEVTNLRDNSKYFVFFRLEFESDVSVGEHEGVMDGRGGRESG